MPRNPFGLLGGVLLLAGCGSGGGSERIEDFIGFESINLNGVTRIEGRARTAELVYDPETGGIVDLVASEGTSDADVYFSIDDAFLVSVRLDHASSELVFGEASAGDIHDAGLYLFALTDDGDKVIFLADDIELDLLYNTYGTWLTGFHDATGEFGTFSVGLPTGNISDPNDTYTYSGDSMGMIRFSDGSFDLTRSNVYVWGHFSSNTIQVNVGDTRKMDNFANALPEYQAYDFSGSGDILGGEFVIDVTGDRVTGTVSGNFYGPNFEEVGGMFLTTAPENETYIGAFGATQDWP